jgi:uncharacterized protein (DUF488 family)
MALYTLGYEGLSIDGFIARLKKAGVKVVCDVRQLPLSRKKGFSKVAFGNALQNAGIAYKHLSVFGCPVQIRDRYKLDQNWKSYEKSFNAYLEGQKSALVELAAFAEKTDVCLVCFEADFNLCHRNLVASAAARGRKLRVVHLAAITGTSAVPTKAAA